MTRCILLLAILPATAVGCNLLAPPTAQETARLEALKNEIVALKDAFGSAVDAERIAELERDIASARANRDVLEREIEARQLETISTKAGEAAPLAYRVHPLAGLAVNAIASVLGVIGSFRRRSAP